jgi:methylenetetrahydrofolate dehydrogenase (NADP+)/methenyltetrahydrofolate cyclohydrolase
VVVACVGKAKLVDAEYIRPGAVVIDVGINADESGALCGDVDSAAVESVCAILTSVPGGVGSVTTSVLARHLIRAAKELQTE